MTKNNMTIYIKTGYELAMETNFFESLREAIRGADASQAEIARKTGTQQASISRFLAGSQGLNADTAIKIVNFLGGRLVFPSTPIPNQSAGAEDLTDKVRELEAQVDKLRDYKAKYEAVLEMEAIRSGNKPQPQQLTLPEPEAKRKIA